MRKLLLALSLLLLTITAFTPDQKDQKERTFTLTVPEHLSFAVYHLLVGDAKRVLSVDQYEQLMPEIVKDVAPQMTEQANKFHIQDSLAELAAKKQPIKDTSKPKQ